MNVIAEINSLVKRADIPPELERDARHAWSGPGYDAYLRRMRNEFKDSDLSWNESSPGSNNWVTYKTTNPNLRGQSWDEYARNWQSKIDERERLRKERIAKQRQQSPQGARQQTIPQPTPAPTAPTTPKSPAPAAPAALKAPAAPAAPKAPKVTAPAAPTVPKTPAAPKVPAATAAPKAPTPAAPKATAPAAPKAPAPANTAYYRNVYDGMRQGMGTLNGAYNIAGLLNGLGRYMPYLNWGRISPTSTWGYWQNKTKS